MNIVIWVLFLASGLLYSIAFFNALIPFLTKRAYEESVFYKISSGAFFLHTLALGLATYKAGALPLSSVYELFMLVAWFIVLIDLVFSKIFKIKLAIFFGAMFAAILVLLPLLCPYFNINVETQIKSPLTISHIVCAGLSYALMGLGFIFAIIQYLQISALQKKKSSMFFRMLPPLSSVNNYIFAVECLASFTMILSIVLGVVAFFAYDMSIATLWIKFLCVFAIFAMQISFVILTNKNLLRGKFQAYFAMIIFVVSLLLMFPIDYR